jgi:hypothetical protein
MPRLGQVNPNLVGPPCLQPAFHHGVFPQPFNRLDVGDRLLPQLRVRRASPPPIPPVFNQETLKGLFMRQVSRHHRQVDPRQAVGAKLQPQLALGINRSGEHHQPTGLAIEAMHRPQTPQRTFLAGRRLLRRLSGGPPPPTPLTPVDDPRQDFVERRLQLLAAAGPVPFFRVP